MPESKYETIIGLEVHIQLHTQAKIFAKDSYKFGTSPNQNLSVITLAHPGTLPQLNKKTVEYAIRLGLACGSEISKTCYFDRKNYFYPDLPKGYQISQDKFPILKGGKILVWVKNSSKNDYQKEVFIHHAHLEEDAGKSVHASGEQTLLDFNRAGTPLIELVTEPCLYSEWEVSAFLNEVRKWVRYLAISDAQMEEGSIRCDVNISLRKKGVDQLGTKVELKNMNSIRFIQQAIRYERERQAEILETKKSVIQETRMYDPDQNKTFSMREKENLNDYRYFPDPDLAPLNISEAWISEIKSKMPEMPNRRTERFVNQYGLGFSEALLLTETKEFADYFEQTCVHSKEYKALAHWLMGPLRSYLNENHQTIEDCKINPDYIARLQNLVSEGKISHSVASQQVFKIMLKKPYKNPLEIVQEEGLLKVDDSQNLEKIIEEILADFPEKVMEFQKGKKGLLGFFMGELMKRTKGTADPKLSNSLLINKLQII